MSTLPRSSHIRRLAGAAALAIVASSTAVLAVVTLSVFTDPHSVMPQGTIGFTFAGNKFVGTVQANGNNVLYQTALDGTNVQLFAPQVNLPSSLDAEHYVTSSLGLGGFPSRDIYVAAGDGIVHITNDGSASNLFVGGLSSMVRGITFDSVGAFSNDMLVTTRDGSVYRINSAGVAALLAKIPEDVEGLDVAPAGTFGPYAGQLFVASEDSGHIRAISPAGVVTNLSTTYNATILNGPEMLSFVPLNLGAGTPSIEGFYAASYPQNVVKAGPEQFVSYKGDLIVTSEFGDHRMTRLHWNGTGIDVEVVGFFPGQPEDGLFVTAVIENPTTSGPSHGCTPGFWKNHATTPPWGGYTPGQALGSVFSFPVGPYTVASHNAFVSETLKDALGGGGGSGLDGKTTILVRAAVAALLNSYNNNPPYPLTEAQIKSQTQALLNSGNQTGMTNLGRLLDNYNNACDR